MNQYYWYETESVPRLNFCMLSNSIASGKFHLAYDGSLPDTVLRDCKGLYLGRMTKSEFAEKHGISFSAERKIKKAKVSRKKK